MVEAADEERKRIGRDLHDGVQQQLVALTQRVDVALRARALLDAQSALPVRVIGLPDRRLPAPIELTVFYLVSEASPTPSSTRRRTG